SPCPYVCRLPAFVSLRKLKIEHRKSRMGVMKRFSMFNFQFSICAAMLIAACHHPAREQTAPAAADIPVGMYAALSGSEAAFGQATLQGAQLAADEINASGGVLGGRKIKLIVEDDQGKAEEAASVVTKL